MKIVYAYKRYRQWHIGEHISNTTGEALIKEISKKEMVSVIILEITEL